MTKQLRLGNGSNNQKCPPIYAKYFLILFSLCKNITLFEHANNTIKIAIPGSK